MTESKPVSQTKTAEQFATEYGYMANNTFTFREIVALLERWAKAKESELAALREQLAQANFRIEHLDGIAALRLTNWNLAEKKASNVAEKLAASERIAEGLATLVRRFHSSHRFMRNPCKKDPCDMCLGAKSVLARYQAQKGKP